MRESKHTMDDYNWPRERILNDDGYGSEQGRQAWENRGYNDEKMNNDYNDAAMRREYNIRENRGGSYDEYGQKSNSFPHPK